MSTTTIRVPTELRSRVESVAAARGSTVHAFMLQAIVEATDRLERRQDFEAEAERRLQHLQATGEYLTIDDLRSHAAAIGHDPQAPAPASRVLEPAALARLRSAMKRAG